MNIISRYRRSLFTQLRLGILPLEIEAGRCTPIYDKSIKKNRKRHPPERLCKLCSMKICENEIHFMLICPMYEHVRQNLIKPVLKMYPCFNTLSSIEKLKLLMQHYPSYNISIESQNNSHTKSMPFCLTNVFSVSKETLSRGKELIDSPNRLFFFIIIFIVTFGFS